MKKLLILLILTFPSMSALAESKDWNKKNVVELCGGMSSVSPFIGDRGKILSIEVKKKPLKTATFKVLSGTMVVTSTCELKDNGRTFIKTDSIKPY
tara:strand:- start:63 stop:350 length:288 start_codon:yes stop_codon:yes gene_type:complete